MLSPGGLSRGKTGWFGGGCLPFPVFGKGGDFDSPPVDDAVIQPPEQNQLGRVPSRVKRYNQAEPPGHYIVLSFRYLPSGLLS